MNIADAIREARKRRGLTQARVAELAGIDQGALSRIEHGTRRPTIQALAAIAHAMGVRPSDLMRRAEELASEDEAA